MSLIAIGMNLILAALLVAAMVVGLRLNRRLKALRDSHEGFEAAVLHLNMAAQRAEQGLADLRAATDEATDLLSDRIEKGRDLVAKLERLVASAPEIPRAMAADRGDRFADRGERPAGRGIPPVAPPPRATATEDRLGALLAMARSRLAEKEAAQVLPERTAERAPPPAARREVPEPLVGRPPIQGLRMPSLDDDLFEDEPLTLDRRTGAPR